MKETIEIYKKFQSIKKKGWIESMRKGSTGVGYTFETLINKKEDNLPFPDYKGFEIKTMRMFSKNKIHLFNATPDGDYLFPIERIKEKIGYPDKTNPNLKILNMSFNAKEYTKIGYYKKAILQIDKENEKIRLLAYDNKNRNLNLNVSWSYSILKEKINLKMNRLIIIKAYNKFIDEKEFFQYKYISFYEWRSFEDFIKLLEEGKIEITFKIGVHKEKEKYGMIHDRGTDFSIKEENICKLYTKIHI